MRNRKLIPPFLFTVAAAGSFAGLVLTSGLPAQQARAAQAAGPTEVVSSPPPVRVDMQHPSNPRQCAGHVALTFDDGPTELTPQLLATLRATDTRATMFNLGQAMERYPAQTRRQALDGHQLANHSHSHPDLVTLSSAQVAAELDRTQQLLAGHGGSTLFRPPNGSIDARVATVAAEQGLTVAMWTVDSKDFEQTTVQAVVERAGAADAGGVVLLHDGVDLTIRALPQIVDTYRARGLCTGVLAATGTPTAAAAAPDSPTHVTTVAAPAEVTR